MKKFIAALLYSTMFSCHPVPAAEPVGTALVLAIDVSASVDGDEYELQRTGLVKAFTDKSVIKAIWNQPFGSMAITVVEWSTGQKIVVPWTIVRDENSALAFAAMVSQVQRSSNDMTHIGDALAFSNALFETCPCVPQRKVIDVSGDGTSNGGVDVGTVRDAVVAQDVTINGLPILNNNYPDLEDHYRERIVGGPGHFVIAANGFDDFARALRHKLVLEIVHAE